MPVHVSAVILGASSFLCKGLIFLSVTLLQLVLPAARQFYRAQLDFCHVLNLLHSAYYYEMLLFRVQGFVIFYLMALFF